jgi:integrase
MPVYKDEKRNTWYVQFWYKDWQGNRRHKVKRGFLRQKDAKEYENAFFNKEQTNTDMTLQSLYENYKDSYMCNLKKSTQETKINIYENHIIPYFKDSIISEISSHSIMMWQKTIRKKGLSKTYLKAINNQMSTLMNFAVRHYGLSSNPCLIAGSMGERQADEMNYWTLDEFNKFIDNVKEPGYHIAFMLLYYAGLRKGELVALTPDDVLKKEASISVNKTGSWINGKFVVTDPKTKQSKRIVTIPQTVYDELEEYISRLYGIQSKDRIFDFGSNNTLNTYLEKIVKRIDGIPKIRIHDLRHSHASLCIDMGINVLLLSKRLGHKNIETTLNTYGHLYPNKQRSLAEELNEKVITSARKGQ